MAPQIKLSEAQINDLSEICALGEELLEIVVRECGKLGVKPMSPSELIAVVTHALPQQHKSAAEPLVRQGLAIHSLRSLVGVSTADALHGLTTGIERHSGWDPDQIRNWRAVEIAFLSFLEQPSVRRVSKALNLSYEYANLLQRARIVTDIRPLYNEDATEIEGTVISQTLRLRYDSADGEHEVSVAMDERDVIALREQCERALRKAEAAKKLMLVKVDVPTLITGSNAEINS